MKITFIQTGGTIDKDYPHTTKGWAFEFGEPAVNRILVKLDPSFEYNVVTACQKDSLELNDQDRKLILESVKSSDSNKIIITHGTDTMIETAEYLANKVTDKTLVITGAMRPERFSNSEADINLGSAIATCNIASPGIYISMHGIVKEYNKIKRDMETGKYY
jgi:L-asparaginase